MYVKCKSKKDKNYWKCEEQNNGEASKRINFETLKRNEKNRYWAWKKSGEYLRFITISYMNFKVFPSMGQKLVFSNSPEIGTLWDGLGLNLNPITMSI